MDIGHCRSTRDKKASESKKLVPSLLKTGKYRANRRTRPDTLFESLSFANFRVRQYPFVYQFIMRLELSHRRSGLWACSKQGVFVTNRKSLLSFQDVMGVAKTFGL